MIPNFDVESLLRRLSSYQKGHPKYTNYLRLMLQPHIDAANLAVKMPSLFDLDTAVGDQLDKVGERVGQGRVVKFPLVSPYFAWDSGDTRGWDRAPWKGPYDDPYGYGVLDDETYRRLLRARIKANTWDGTVPGAQAILDTFFIDPETRVIVEDRGNAIRAKRLFAWDDPTKGWDIAPWSPGPELARSPMQIVISLSGKIPPVVDLALLDAGYIPPKPAAIKVEYAVTTVDESPVFGFDVENEYISGWDTGAWGAPPNVVAVTNYA